MPKSAKEMYYLFKATGTTGELMQLIRQADEAAIQKIAMAILFRYEELFPDWELAYLALPIDPAQRELALEAAFDQLRKYHK